MSTVIDLFERHGYVLELLACVAATTWKLERQERFAARLTGILLAEACFTIVWEQVPHNLYTESLRTFLLWSIAAVGIRLCFRIAAAWAVFYATAAGTMQHIIYRGAKLLQNAVYHMDRQYWAWSRWVYLGLFVLLFAVCCLTLTRRLHSRNLGTLPGRTMTFIMVGYQLSMNIFVNLFNAFSVDSAPRIFTVYSVYDEVTTILLFFLLCEILQHSDAEWDNMVLQQMMRQQRQQMELGEPDASGRRRPIVKEGSEFVLDVDTMIMALGTSPNPLIRSTTPGLDADKHGCLITNGPDGLTSRPMVYAGGDAVTGAATVILAMGAGKEAARAIDAAIKAKEQ